MRKAAATAAVLASALALSACASEDLIAPVPQAAVAGPVIDRSRIETLIADTQTVVDAADTAVDATGLSARFGDPALRMRKAQYGLQSAVGTPVPHLTLLGDNIAVTDSQTWPRTMVSIGSVGDSGLPTAFIFVQNDARSSYRLQSWVRLLGGTEFTIPNIQVGSNTVQGTSEGFVRTPEETLASYVELINSGAESNEVFGADEFTSKMRSDVNKLNESVQASGSVTAGAQLSDLPISGVVLENGSALVSASFTYTLTYARTVAGSNLRLSGATAALAPGEDPGVKGSAVANYLTTVLFLVPSAQAGGTISVVGAEQVLESVAVDESTSPD
ncbi:hypothetical protein [Schaalia suimastitidis]|uniref:hypothetical protein n=1 Tax=Schaalia suimastitidis TaxID=121163 RepID=UPI000428CED0|nr:hypothetical protein [Schaalia suimastitidis]